MLTAKSLLFITCLCNEKISHSHTDFNILLVVGKRITIFILSHGC